MSQKQRSGGLSPPPDAHSVLIRSNVKILNAERIALDEPATGFNAVAHQDGKEIVGLEGVLGAN